MDDKTVFKLKLQGKEDGGYLEFWSNSRGDLAGIKEGKDADTAEYILGWRNDEYGVSDGYAINADKFYKLGEQVSHAKLIEILAGAHEGKYYDPDHKRYMTKGALTNGKR